MHVAVWPHSTLILAVSRPDDKIHSIYGERFSHQERQPQPRCPTAAAAAPLFTLYADDEFTSYGEGNRVMPASFKAAFGFETWMQSHKNLSIAGEETSVCSPVMLNVLV